MTISFMNLYYGTPIFDCLEWFENFLTIDPEQTVMGKVIFERVNTRTIFASEFSNAYQIQTLISKLVSMRYQPFHVMSEQEILNERTRVQQIYDEILDILEFNIRKRAEDTKQTSSFAYDSLLYLFASESYNSSKRVERCLQIFTKYPQFLFSALEKLCQEIDIMVLQESDNVFYSHLRFILIEVHNITKTLICGNSRAEHTVLIDRLISRLQEVFQKINNATQLCPLKDVADLIFVQRHYSEIVSFNANRENLEKAIQIQSLEMKSKNEDSNEDHFAFCYYKLGSLYRRILKRRDEKKKKALHSQLNEVKHPISAGESVLGAHPHEIVQGAIVQGSNPHEIVQGAIVQGSHPHEIVQGAHPHEIVQSAQPHEIVQGAQPHEIVQEANSGLPNEHQAVKGANSGLPNEHQAVKGAKSGLPNEHQAVKGANSGLPNEHQVVKGANIGLPNEHQVVHVVEGTGNKIGQGAQNGYDENEYRLNGELTTEEEYYKDTEKQMKNWIEKSESLYEARVKDVNKIPLSKILSAFYLGRINEKHRLINSASTRYYNMVIEMHSQYQDLLNNCRTTQFEIIYHKTLKRLNRIQSLIPIQVLPPISNSEERKNEKSIVRAELEVDQMENQSPVKERFHKLDNKLKTPVNKESELFNSNLIGEYAERQTDAQADLYSTNFMQGGKLTAINATFQTISSYRAMNNIQRIKEKTNSVTSLIKSFQRETIVEIPAREIKLKSMLRKGQFGSVYTILYKEELYAGKLIQFVPQSFYEKLHKELIKNLEIVHPVLFPILAISKWPSDKLSKRPTDPIHVLLIMDLKKSCLEQILREHILKQSQAYGISVQISEGICALHSKGVVHSNLKLKNILVDNNLNAFISDWGVSHLFWEEVDRDFDEFATCLAFSAPELQQDKNLEKKEESEGQEQKEEELDEGSRIGGTNLQPHSMAADVWAFGVILLCLFFDFFPTQNNIRDVGLYSGLSLPSAKFNNFQGQLYPLVKDMLAIVPQSRISMSEVHRRLVDAGQELQLDSVAECS